MSRRRFSFLALWIVAFGSALVAADVASTAPSSPKSARPNHVLADLKLTLIWVEPGRFMMGTPADAPDRNKADGPYHEVTITHGFWLGRTEVTQAQYEAIVGKNPSTFTAVGPDAPVEGTSWIDAMAFCEKLTARERAAGRLPEGYGFTLPTEAEWEYACRAGTTGSYPDSPEGMAWHVGNSDNTTHRVAQKRPNPWGFYDMQGNVLEWCYDWYDPDLKREPAVDPQGPRRGYYRIARGGSWRTSLETGRSAARSGGSAGRQDYTIGFRVALCAERK